MGSISAKQKKKTVESMDYISWFEIPVINFEQAVTFYNQIFGISMEINNTTSHSMAFFPSKSGIGGAVVCGPGAVPGDSGPLLYLNGGNDLNTILSKVEQAGGRVVLEKTLISEEAGHFSIFIDSEGNRLALHSRK